MQLRPPQLTVQATVELTKFWPHWTKVSFLAEIQSAMYSEKTTPNITILIVNHGCIVTASCCGNYCPAGTRKLDGKMDGTKFIAALEKNLL